MAQPIFTLTPTSSPQTLALIKTLLASGGLQEVGAPASGVQAPAAATSAEDAVAAIPVAEDGDVIRADFHNLTRAALVALVQEAGLGRGPVAPLSPAFLADD